MCSENLPILLPMSTNPDNNNGGSGSYCNYFSRFANTQLENQRMELHYLINSQNELLRQSLHQYTTHQFASILATYDSYATVLLRQKDDEIAKGKIRNIELQEFLNKIVLENQAWQRMAIYNETVFLSLTNALSYVNNENNADLGNGNAAEDAESWCDDDDDDEDEERLSGGRGGESNIGICCRRCNSKSSSVVFLPCRHLCSCQTCEPLMVFCPVCQMLKKSAILALI